MGGSTRIPEEPRSDPPNKFPILSILKSVLIRQKSELISEVKLREACLLFTLYSLLFTNY